MDLSVFTSKDCRVGIIGMGYVGLPLARSFCRGGLQVTGFDINPDHVESLRRGRTYFKHIPSEDIAVFVAEGRLIPTADFDLLREQDAIIICVPTPLTDNKDPDMTFIESATRSIRDRLRPGQLVVLESTTYPGTTRDVVAKILNETGLLAGRDYYLAFSPEREDPGRKDMQTHEIPKVIGGINAASLEAGVHLYGHAIKSLVPVSSCEIAEMAKLLENIYRCVNIALVNELKMLMDRMGINIWEVIDAARTKPFGFQAFLPGPGLGGHCIPIDPFYLSWKAREFGMTTRFIELAGEINTAMPAFVVGKVADALNEHRKSLRGSRILILGMAYKADIDDMRESPSTEIYEMLQHKGAIVSYNDPHIPRTPRQRKYDLQATSIALTPESLAAHDCVLVLTAHTRYDWDFIVRHSQLVVDTRNATRDVQSTRVVRA